MKPIEESRKIWDAIFRDNNNFSDLKSEQSGALCRGGLRSIYWKAFLLFDGLSREQWSQKISESRSTYSALKSHFLKYIEHPDDLQSTVDPLADDEESPWQALRSDERIRADISQDVDRCLQENPYFHELTTKVKMVDILFIYCKLNPDLGYRQGMHELLAPILWVVDLDSAGTASASKADGDPLIQLLDGTYVEHDAFALFCRVMQMTRIYYEHREQPSVSGPVDTIPIVSRCQYLHNGLLMAIDSELGVHLEALEILPQIFLTRWMRLLFGREFPFEDTLSIWDLLFANGLEPDLVDFVCIAMLLRIRWQLLKADHSSALTMLLHYPSPHPYDPQTFIDDALYLQQHLTLEGGSFIILKYSGKSPGRSKQIYQTSTRSSASLKAVSDNFRSRIEGSPLARASKGSGKGTFDGFLQDISGGMQRGTEIWSVAKAVRSAVTDAKRNTHTMQWDRPRTLRPEGTSSSARRTTYWTQGPKASTVDMKDRIELLEQRNKTLARMLGEALSDLRAQSVDAEGSDTSLSERMKITAARIEFVQVCLRDSSIPVDIADMHPGESDEDQGEMSGRPPSTGKTNLPAEQSVVPDRQRVDHCRSSDADELTISAQSHSAMRQPLAESEFSWMLDRDRHLSSFASSASLPPEQTRHVYARATAPLFANGSESQRRGSADLDVAMSSLRRKAGCE